MIVFLCLVFHPDTSASSILFTDLFRRLAADGTPVRVLCGFPSKDGAVGAVPRRERFGEIEIVRCGLRIEGKRSLLSRAIVYSSFLLHAGWKILRLGDGATVLGGTDPPFTAAALWLLSCLRRFTYQCILLDAYPDGLVALGRLDARSPLTRLWRLLNRLSYRRAERVLVIGRDMIDLLHRTYGLDPGEITYIPHWGTAEVESAGEMSREALLDRLGLGEKFVVQYSGNMGLWHDIETLVHAAELLRDDPRIHFLFIGKGMRRAGAEQLSRRLGLANVTWLDFMPRERLPETLAGCDVALISFRAGLEGVAVPSKLYGILASGRAVLAQAPGDSEVARVVIEERCGVVVPPGDACTLAGAVRSLVTDPEGVRAMGRRAREAYHANYTLDRAVERFEKIRGSTLDDSLVE